MISTLVDLVSWAYIAYLCDTIFGRLFQAIKSRLTKGIEHDKEAKDHSKASLGEILSWESPQPAPANVKEKNATPRDKFDDGEGWREIDSSPKPPSSIFGGRVDLTGIHSYRWRDDPLIKDGFFRVDKINADGSKKTSNYYDESGKLVYQRLKEMGSHPQPNEVPVPVTPGAPASTEPNPEFFIKPQASPSLGGVSGLEEGLNKNFTGVLGNPGGEIKSAKTQIDEHVNQTFKEIFDIVKPKIF